MLPDALKNALNDQMNFEIYSANIYMSMATWFDAKNLAGFANWMKVQYQEEMFHAMKFYGYINERGGRVLLSGSPDLPTEWDSPAAIFQHALEHEQIVTGRINDLVNLSQERKDHATTNFLQWYVAEQVEEESGVDAVLQQLTLMGDAPGGLFMIDRELSARVYTPPADAAM